MEIKTEGVVLQSRDYRENDRQVVLLTPTLGKITALARGVKKAGAKLRFAVQPFCFAEYVLAEKAGRYTLISAACHESFFALSDPDKFYAACAVTEIASAVSLEGAPSASFFLETVKTLLSMEEGDPAEPLVSFVLAALEECGVPVEADGCAFCGKQIGEDKLFFHFPTGSFSCPSCHKGTPVSRSTYLTIRKHEGLSFEGSFDRDTSLRTLRLLKEYFVYKTELEVKCFREYIRQLQG
ncbi:MAG: DNA repair protein RecO [Clostridia bacterium]|nr:DNA repair protein RecO [Clostridia bacterium]